MDYAVFRFLNCPCFYIVSTVYRSIFSTIVDNVDNGIFVIKYNLLRLFLYGITLISCCIERSLIASIQT